MKTYRCLVKNNWEALNFDYKFKADNDEKALEHLAEYLNNSFDKRFLSGKTVEVLETGKYRNLKYV